MHEHLLTDIGISIVGAVLLAFPAYLLKLPLLLAYLAAGVILGPHLGFGIVKSAESIATLSEIGLVLLMFILGLEINLSKLMQAGKPVIVNGVTQFVGCAAIALGFFGLLVPEEMLGTHGLTYLAVATSLSSTLIVVKILSDRMDLDTFPSRITLGILVLQDLWAICFLALQPNLDHLSASAIGLSFGKAGILVAVAWLLARFALPWLFARAGRQPELMLILAMAWCFLMSGLGGVLGLSPEMGALLAGMSVASFPYHADIAAKVASLRDFFITLFFVSLGLRIPMPTGQVLFLASLITVFALTTRVITIFPVLHLMRFGNRASLLPALNLSQLSEFALVLVSLGVGLGHVPQDLLSAVVLATVACALISSGLIPSGHSIYRALNPLLEKIGFRDHVSHDAHTPEPRDQAPAKVVLLGFFRDGSSLLEEILRRHSKHAAKDVLVVDFNPEAHHKLKKMGVRCKYGDIGHVDTLVGMGLEQAEIVVCTIPDQTLKGTTNLKLLRALKKLTKARIVVTAERFDAAVEMYQGGADFVFVPRLVGAQFLVDVLERLQVDGAPTVRAESLALLKTRREVIP
ncbi:MAG: cation:proton antiporter [Bdellovibrionales bacterium]|nr:cation:proton antiporter [Bdellovibrionales bacterium]